LANGMLERMLSGIPQVMGIPCVAPNSPNLPKLAAQVQRSLLPGDWISLERHPNPGLWNEVTVAWVRESGTQELMKDPHGGVRFSGPDYLKFVDTKFAWPPPVRKGNLASNAWTFEYEGSFLPGDFLAEAWKLSTGAIVIFRLLKETDGKIGPSNKWLIRIPEKGGKPLKIGSVMLTWTPSCSFCWRGPLAGEGHTHHQCPWLSAMNKAREKINLHPMSFDHLTGAFSRIDAERPADVQATLKDHGKRLDTVEAAVKGLQTAKPAPSKAQPQEKEGKGKKRKADEPAPEAEAPKKKKSKKGKKKKATESQAAETSTGEYSTLTQSMNNDV